MLARLGRPVMKLKLVVAALLSGLSVIPTFAGRSESTRAPIQLDVIVLI